MNRIKISIIMPVHNTGIYLEESLNSIFVQSFQEFELICVDDASKDKQTKDILKSYQTRYGNMQVIWLKDNVGAGEARNIGFLKAKGLYTIFLDADDIFAESLLEKMYQCICKNHADVCVCGYQVFYINNGRKYYGAKYIPDEYKINFDNRENWLLDIPMAAWNKLCRTEFLKENNIYFQSTFCCNDVFFSCMVMILAKKRCFIEYLPLIFYRTKSKTQISANRNPVDLYSAVMLIKDKCRRGDDNGLLLSMISTLLLTHGISETRSCRNERYNRQFYDLIREFFNSYIISFQNHILSACMENVKKNPYKKEWFFDCLELEGQLRLTAKKIKEKVAEERQIYLWGLGYRGNIFQKFCKEQGIVLNGVTDIKNQNIGRTTEYGNKILSTEDVLKSKGLVITSNRQIYEYLQKRELRLLNLAEFYVF